MGLKPLIFPYPFKAWMSICNDPDNTTEEGWKKLDELIFKELKLPWANSIFITSHNLNLPEQVNLTDHPYIDQQPTDTIHTWGDFVHAGQKGFSREDALKAIEKLKSHNISPRIWVDHSRFVGNLVLPSNLGQTPTHTDATGFTYINYEYTLDLIKQLGIRYVWDGVISARVGQDMPLDHTDTLLRKMKRKISRLIRKYRSPNDPINNDLLTPAKFNDGSKMYLLKRYGRWKYADIDHFHHVVNEANLQKLIQRNAPMVLYTHLGKSAGNGFILKEETKSAFLLIKKYYDDKLINFSSTSALLDYVVILKHLRIDENKIIFQSDGIRFEKLQIADLASHRFSFSGTTNEQEIQCFIDDQPITFNLIRESKNIFTLQF